MAVGAPQVRIAEVRLAQIGTAKVGAGEIDGIRLAREAVQLVETPLSEGE